VPLLWLFWRWQRKMLKRLGAPALIGRQIGGAVRYGGLGSAVVILFSVLMLVAALANPLSGSRPKKIKQKGLDLVLAIDVSKSMLAEDLKPSRMTRAKQFASRLVSLSEGDQIGLVVFAANAYIQMPLSPDHAGAQMYINTITTEMVPLQGTYVAEALGRAAQMLVPIDSLNPVPQNPTPDNSKAKVIVLISDGENHDEEALEIAAEAADRGITIYTVGAGKPDGAPIPLYDKEGNRTGMMQDRTGKMVISQLNEQLLHDISQIGQGEYFRLADEDAAKKLGGKLATLQREEREVEILTEFESRFQWFVGAALLTLFIPIALQFFPGRRFESKEE
jgi:Ca-activated chloride channel homolog